MSKVIIIYVALKTEEHDPDRLADRIRQLSGLTDFELLPVYLTRDEWFTKLSFDFNADRNTAASAFLDEILNIHLPEALKSVPQECNTPDILIAGYSLAGLFSLWCLYNTDVFCGAISGSGSLWYEGFSDYVYTHGIRRPGIVYLSLGSKEHKSRNPLMRTVMEKTEAVYGHLKNEANVEAVVFEMNPGNHFQDVDERMVKGIAWALKHTI
ncbi:MAG: hypothetical protein HUJ76_07810 [Parasporobacterium sp.]|nr:hypothetical protein [Parasporobacterium sp.]